MSEQIQDNIGSKVLFENEQVKVWELQLQPGENHGMHSHKNDYMLIFVGDGKLRAVNADGSTRYEKEINDGDVFYRSLADDEDVHDAHNVGDKPIRNFIIEMKKQK